MVKSWLQIATLDKLNAKFAHPHWIFFDQPVNVEELSVGFYYNNDLEDITAHMDGRQRLL
jgi:hypothetical protein